MPLHDLKQTWQKAIAFALFVGLCAFSVIRGVSELQFSPDSANYITAAQNLIRTGHLFVYTNYPSWSMEPVIEPYTEQPFGFPLYLVPFLLVLKQPFLAAAVVHALSIILLYGAVWALVQDYGMGPGFQVACISGITLFRPLAFIFTNFWSETLFIALTLWAIHFLLIARDSKRPVITWLLALGLASAASATRAIGVLTLGLFLLGVFCRPAVLRSKKSSQTWIGLAFLFILGPLAAWFLRNRLLYGSVSMTHTVKNFFIAETLIQPFNFLLDMAGSSPFMRLLVAGFAVVCLAVPFLIPGLPVQGTWHLKTNFTKVHFSSLLLAFVGIALITVALASDRLGFGGPTGIGLKQSIMIDLGVLSVLGAWLVHTNISEGVRAWGAHYDWSWWQSRVGHGYLLLLAGGLCQLLGIVALSLVTPFSKLEDRLLAPSLALLLLAMLVGLRQLAGLIRARHFARGVLDVTFILAMASPAVLKGGIIFQPGFHFPPEQQLWQELYTYPGIRKVSHFYSDSTLSTRSMLTDRSVPSQMKPALSKAAIWIASWRKVPARLWSWRRGVL